MIYNFCFQDGCADGALPVSGLTIDAAGHMFGATDFGGAHSNGALYELVRTGRTWTETVLYSFCSIADCADGSLAIGKLLLDPLGNLIGTAVLGGLNNQGVIFKLAPDGPTSEYSVLYNFCSQPNCEDGSGAVSELITDLAGNLFGTTMFGGGNNIDLFGYGGGTVFKLVGSSFRTLYRFCSDENCADGEYPYAGVIMDASGHLLGMAEAGGPHSGGEVFSLPSR